MRLQIFIMIAVFEFCCVVKAAPANRERILQVPQDYQTISSAIAAAEDGDRIKVANGIYAEQIVINKAIKLEGTDPKKTIIDGTGVTSLSDLGQVRITATDNVEVSKFTIVNSGRPADGYNVAIYCESPVSDNTYEIHHCNVFWSLDTSQELFSGYPLCQHT